MGKIIEMKNRRWDMALENFIDAGKSNSNSDKVILKSEFPTDDEYIDYGFIERDEDSFKPKIKTLSDEVESMDYENLMF